jgi:hypothetical protein
MKLFDSKRFLSFLTTRIVPASDAIEKPVISTARPLFGEFYLPVETKGGESSADLSAGAEIWARREGLSTVLTVSCRGGEKITSCCAL